MKSDVEMRISAEVVRDSDTRAWLVLMAQCNGEKACGTKESLPLIADAWPQFCGDAIRHFASQVQTAVFKRFILGQEGEAAP